VEVVLVEEAEERVERREPKRRLLRAWSSARRGRLDAGMGEAESWRLVDGGEGSFLARTSEWLLVAACASLSVAVCGSASAARASGRIVSTCDGAWVGDSSGMSTAEAICGL